jgi:CRISPR/Cas system endoribonuclease Cas6 (RAMP superfamily)
MPTAVREKQIWVYKHRGGLLWRWQRRPVNKVSINYLYFSSPKEFFSHLYVVLLSENEFFIFNYALQINIKQRKWQERHLVKKSKLT